MSRLPTPGGDQGDWGAILNDFLRVSHNDDGSLKNRSINIKDLGAKGDGVTDDTAAIQKAIDSIKATGGTIFFPRSSKAYLCAGSLNLDDSQGVRLLGEEGLSWGQTQILYAGSGTGSFITAFSSYGFEMHNLSIAWNSPSYTGDLINFDWSAKKVDAAYMLIENCVLVGASDSAGLVHSIIRLNRTIISTIRNCSFRFADVAIRLGDPSYANGIQIENCMFLGQNTVPIYGNSNQSCMISGCTFETLRNKNAAGFHQNPQVWSWGLTIIGCWFGDISKSPGAWLELHCLGANVSGNFFGSPGPADTDTHIRFINCQGVSIQGNRFEGHTGLDFTTTTSSRGTFVGGNDFGGATIVNSGNNLYGSFFGNNGIANQTTAGMAVYGYAPTGITNETGIILGRKQSSIPSQRPAGVYWLDGFPGIPIGSLGLTPGSNVNNTEVVAFAGNPATPVLRTSKAGVGFNGVAPSKPTITGSRGGNAAVADLLSKLASMGLIVDGTTA